MLNPNLEKLYTRWQEAGGFTPPIGVYEDSLNGCYHGDQDCEKAGEITSYQQVHPASVLCPECGYSALVILTSNNTGFRWPRVDDLEILVDKTLNLIEDLEVFKTLDYRRKMLLLEGGTKETTKFLRKAYSEIASSHVDILAEEVKLEETSLFENLQQLTPLILKDLQENHLEDLLREASEVMMPVVADIKNGLLADTVKNALVEAQTRMLKDRTLYLIGLFDLGTVYETPRKRVLADAELLLNGKRRKSRIVLFFGSGTLAELARQDDNLQSVAIKCEGLNEQHQETLLQLSDVLTGKGEINDQHELEAFMLNLMHTTLELS